jgi:hypothetical protein
VDPLLLVSAAVAIFCLGAVVHYHATGNSTTNSLVSIGSLGKEDKDFRDMEQTVRKEMDSNDNLSEQYDSTFKKANGGDKDCGCNCKNHAPEMKAKAAQMLAQVGEVRVRGATAEPRTRRMRPGGCHDSFLASLAPLHPSPFTLHSPLSTLHPLSSTTRSHISQARLLVGHVFPFPSFSCKFVIVTA